ncbi:hypothetical protein AAH446_14550 [Erwinia sp. P6884]|uniref:hypothetical protein n=1 Tax=Erwinia sp. P6884 TaxID=3141450 RepID=UPI0031909848
MLTYCQRLIYPASITKQLRQGCLRTPFTEKSASQDRYAFSHAAARFIRGKILLPVPLMPSCAVVPTMISTTVIAAAAVAIMNNAAVQQHHYAQY